MKIQVQQAIDVPLKDAWEIFGHGFADIQNWSSFVKTSVAITDGTTVGDATISGRNCDTDLGTLDETLQIFNNDNHEIKFLVEGDSFPFFMRSIISHWQFSEDNGKTLATTEVDLNLVFPFSILMGWAIKRSFTKVILGVGAELEVYAKTRA